MTEGRGNYEIASVGTASEDYILKSVVIYTYYPCFQDKDWYLCRNIDSFSLG